MRLKKAKTITLMTIIISIFVFFVGTNEKKENVDDYDKYSLQMSIVNGEWVAIDNGIVSYNYTGMACNEYGWWYYRDGRLDWNYTGMACNEYGWWYYRNGRLDWNYTGIACNEYGKWIYIDGQIDFSISGMVYINNEWLYADKGHIINYTGMAENNMGWWYYQDGRLDWNYTGMASNEYGWWYYQNGKLDWDYTGMACNEYGWWYYCDGRLDWDYTGLAENEFGKWYYKDGRIDFTFSGNIEEGFIVYNIIDGYVFSVKDRLAEYSWGQSLDKMNYDADIVFFGDSITTESDFAKYFSDVYTGEITELGLSGDTVSGMIGRTDMIKSVSPEKIFVMAGINQLTDTNSEKVLMDYEQLISNIRNDNPDAQIYIQSILPISAEMEVNHVTNKSIQSFNILLKQLADAKSCVYIELNPLFIKDGFINEEYTVDGLHLNGAGYAVWGEEIRDYIVGE